MRRAGSRPGREAHLPLSRVLLAGLVALWGAPPAADDLARGIALAREGRCGRAVPRLERALDRLPPPPAAARERASAYLHLGACRVEQGEERAGEACFARALDADPAARPEGPGFSAKARERFEATRRKRTEPGGAVEGYIEGRVVGEAARWKRPAVVAAVVALAGAAVAARGGAAPSTGSTVASTTTTITSTTSTTTSTTTTTTTTPPPCRYAMSGGAELPIGGGSGSCSVQTMDGCPWTARADDDWIRLTSSTGRGNGIVRFDVPPNNGAPRVARVTLDESRPASCEVRQDGIVRGEGGDASWMFDLAVPGARGQVFVNGVAVADQGEGPRAGTVRVLRGRENQVVASLVSARGIPGRWTFRWLGPIVPGSLRVVEGAPEVVLGDAVTFRMAGAPGARVAFAFRALP